MSALGRLAICLLLLSASVSSYSEFCLLLGRNRDVPVPADLGSEASPSLSSSFTQAFGFLRRSRPRDGGDPREPPASPSLSSHASLAAGHRHGPVAQAAGRRSPSEHAAPRRATPARPGRCPRQRSSPGKFGSDARIPPPPQVPGFALA